MRPSMYSRATSQDDSMVLLSTTCASWPACSSGQAKPRRTACQQLLESGLRRRSLITVCSAPPNLFQNPFTLHLTCPATPAIRIAL